MAIPSTLRTAPVAFGLAACFAAAATGADWPQFHGPRRDNISTETGLLKRWPEGGPKRLWTARGLGYGYSSVAVTGGRIYTAGNAGGRTVVTALDLDGKPLWRAACGAEWAGPYPGTRSTPTVDGERLYYETPLGELVCLAAADGKRLWSVNLLKRFGGKNIHWGLAESPLVDGERLICSPGGTAGGVVALEKTTGKVIWRCVTGDRAGYASPILVEQDGLRMVITLTLKALVGIDAETGRLLWRVPHVSYADENVLVPIYHDGCVFVSSVAAGSVKWQVTVKGRNASVRELWRNKHMDNHHGGVVLLGGHLYGSSCAYNRNRWVCLDWRTGQAKYVAEGVGKGSPTVADGLLYVLGERGTMGLVRPTPAGHEVLSRFELPRQGKGPWWAHPVVCGGRLYVRHGEFLYAYDLSGAR